MRHPSNIVTNGRVAFGTCLVFGLVLYTERGWQPVSSLSNEMQNWSGN